MSLIERIFNIETPVIYTFFKVPLKLIYPDSDNKINHILIMSGIGASKGAFNGNSAASIEGGVSALIKFGLSYKCQAIILMVLPTDFKSYKSNYKFVCSSVGHYVSSLYKHNGYIREDFLPKAILSSIFTTAADYIKESADGMRYFPFDEDDFQFREMLTIVEEVADIPANAAHTIVLNVGKLFTNLCFEPLFSMIDYEN